MAEKLCVFCKHLEYNEDTGGDYADPANLTCRKKHLIHEKSMLSWQKNVKNIYDIEDFRKVILHAKNCHDYTEVK